MIPHFACFCITGTPFLKISMQMIPRYEQTRLIDARVNKQKISRECASSNLFHDLAINPKRSASPLGSRGNVISGMHLKRKTVIIFSGRWSTTVPIYASNDTV